LPGPSPSRSFSNDLLARFLSKSRDREQSEDYISIPRCDTDSVGRDDGEQELTRQGSRRRRLVQFSADTKVHDGVSARVLPYFRFVCDCFLNDPSFTAHYIRHHSVPVLSGAGLVPMRRSTINTVSSLQNGDNDTVLEGDRHRHSLSSLEKPAMFSSKMAMRLDQGSSSGGGSQTSGSSGSLSKGSFGSNLSAKSTSSPLGTPGGSASGFCDSEADRTGTSERDNNEKEHEEEDEARSECDDDDEGELSPDPDADADQGDRSSRRQKSKHRHKHKHKHKHKHRSKSRRRKHKSDHHAADSSTGLDDSQRQDASVSVSMHGANSIRRGHYGDSSTRRREQDSDRKVQKSVKKSPTAEEGEEEGEEDDDEEEEPPRPPLTPQEAWDELPEPRAQHEVPTLQLLHDLCRRYSVAMRRHDHQVCPVLGGGGSSRAVYRAHVATLRAIKQFVDAKFLEMRGAVTERSACKRICRAVYAHHRRQWEARNEQRFKYIIRQNELVKIPL